MTRSAGAGGGFGVTANTLLCAVVDCTNTPKPQVCPYDGTQHRHGAIHYWIGYPAHSLQFRAGDWFWICDPHYAVCVQERRAFEAQSRCEVHDFDLCDDGIRGCINCNEVEPCDGCDRCQPDPDYDAEPASHLRRDDAVAQQRLK